MIRVAYVIDSLVGGGAETSLASLAPFYAQRAIELDVIYLKDTPGLQDELEAAGGGLYCAAGSGGRAGNARRIAAHLRDRRPDLVHTTLFEADVAGRIAAKLTRVPVVSSLVNVQYGPEHYAAPHIKSWRLKAAQVVDVTTARLTTRMHALTAHVADSMSDRLSIPRTRIDVIPRGRDASVLGVRSSQRSRAAREAIGVADSVPLVLAASRQEYQKGLDILLAAWPRVSRAFPDAVLAIAGREGNHTPALRSLAEPHGESINWLGARNDVPDLLAAADVFVLPSRWEGLGSVLIEAMALEAPIVASDLPPVREVVADCATLFPAEHPDALAAALAGALTDPSRGSEMAERGRKRFEERFTTATVADQMRTFYETALGRESSVLSEQAL
jgi:glycosyltransferase involved in cell wall biosynthesis